MSRTERLEVIYDTFSVRNRGTSAMSDLTALPDACRHRILRFWTDETSDSRSVIRESISASLSQDFWLEMESALLYLYGRASLRRGQHTVGHENVSRYLYTCSTVEFFDFMELSFKLPSSWRILHDADDFIGALNGMFRIEELPYEMTNLVTHEEVISDQQDDFDREEYFLSAFDDGPATRIVTDAYPQVIRVDDQIPHREAVQPALAALSAPHFAQANDELLKALRHYRNDEFADCLTLSASALESVIKIICDRNQWPYNRRDTLDPLLDIVIERKLLDPFYKQALMFVGTIRNRFGSAHGRGSDVRPVPHHIARHAITSAANAIALITAAEADR